MYVEQLLLQEVFARVALLDQVADGQVGHADHGRGQLLAVHLLQSLDACPAETTVRQPAAALPRTPGEVRHVLGVPPPDGW